MAVTAPAVGSFRTRPRPQAPGPDPAPCSRSARCPFGGRCKWLSCVERRAGGAGCQPWWPRASTDSTAFWSVKLRTQIREIPATEVPPRCLTINFNSERRMRPLGWHEVRTYRPGRSWHRGWPTAYQGGALPLGRGLVHPPHPPFGSKSDA